MTLSLDKNAGGIPRPLTAPLGKAAEEYVPRRRVNRQYLKGKGCNDSESKGTLNKRCRGKPLGSWRPTLSGGPPLVYHEWTRRFKRRMSKDPNNRTTEQKGGTVKEITSDNSTGLTPCEANCAAPPFSARASASAPFPKPFLPQLLQPVLLKGVAVTEKAVLALALKRVLVSYGGQLDPADVVGHLKQPVAFGRRVFVNDCRFGNRFAYREVYGIAHYLLAVVVIDFDQVVFLEIGKISIKEESEIFLHAFCKFARAFVIAFPKNEGLVLDRGFFGEHTESCEITFPFVHGVSCEPLVAAQHRREMERRVGESRVGKGSGEARQMGIDAACLVVEYQRKQIESGTRSDVSRFVDENGQLAHETTSKIKNAGGNPPALGQPSIAERCLFYTTNQGAFSRCNYTEHTFASQYINPGKSIRKAA